MFTLLTDNFFDYLDSMNNNFYTFPPNRIIEDEAGIRLQLALSGWEKEDISVEYDEGEGLLVIAGNPKNKITENDRQKVIFSNLVFKKFRQVYRVNAAKFDCDSINVKFKDGMLEVVVPKTEKRKTKFLTIK